MIESTVLAIIYTAVPVLLLFVLQTTRQTTPLNMILWLLVALGWMALITYLYVKKFSKRGGLTLRE
ncbi:MAG: hypothetical protein QXG52_05830 [Candidatus Caldarchaeum sp.]